ncbi:MAG: disulfide bond formation protein B [Gemmatimonadales bacterium]|nr:MAG: disulfide bond formation protein B [Gemmatimonadales bacterium]
MDLIGISRTLASLSLLSAVFGLLLLALLVAPGGRRLLAREVHGQRRLLLLVAWITATVSTVGSLYLSDVVGFVPCLLCWYQRIAMYPLVLVLGTGVITADRRTWRWGLPLAISGLLIALYHISIQFRPALDVGMCDVGVPCSARYLSVFGWVSIPVLAAGGFLLISALLLVARLDREGEEAPVRPLEPSEPSPG